MARRFYVSQPPGLGVTVTVSTGAMVATPLAPTVTVTSTPAALPPIGALYSAGGASVLSYEQMPLFWNQVRSSRGFTSSTSFGNGNASVSPTTGWPTSDFSVMLLEGTAPSWLSGTWHCGFIGTGSETIAANGCTLSNVVHAGGGAYTTFQLSGGGTTMGFTVTGTTGGVTNVFAYIPGYTGNALVIDDVTQAASYFTNNVNSWKGMRHIRTMIPGNMWQNTQQGTSANRHSAANTQTNPRVGITSTSVTMNGAALSAPWALPSGAYAVATGATSTASSWHWGNFVNGSEAITWISTAPAAGSTLTFGIEGYPIEWFVGLANAAGCGIWVNTPLWEDGTSGAAGSWTSSVMQYLAANFSGPVYYEMGNENWNGTYYGFGLLSELASFYGYSDVYKYLAYRFHAFANLGRTYHGAAWGQTVFQVPCWQTVTASNFSEVFATMQANGNGSGAGNILSADVHYCAIAPYLTPTGLTSTSTTAQIAAAVSAQASGVASNAETWFILAKHYGMNFCSYEAGLQWNSASGITGTNLSAALDDTTGAMQSAIEAVYQTYANVPYSFISHTEAGVTGGGTGSKSDEFSYNYTNFLAGNPTLQAIQSFSAGFVPSAKNTITGPGSTIPGGNYADHTGASAVLNLTGQPPLFFAGQGYLAYAFYCPAPVTVTFKGNFTGTGTTNVWIDGTEVATGVAVSTAASPVTLATNQTLGQGWHYIMLGTGSSQAGVTVNSIVT